jgi:hypothetical protein
LIHEIAIGLVLNKLRAKIPFFMYVYGGFYCSMPPAENLIRVGVDPSTAPTELSQVCADDRKEKMHACMLAEYIGKAVYLGEFLEDTSRTQHDIDLVVYLVLAAIAIAYNDVKFIHGDLHKKNVLVQTRSNLHTYTVAGVKLQTRYRPVIIDFGRSTAEFDGKKILPMADPSLWGNCIEGMIFGGSDLPWFDAMRLLTQPMGSGRLIDKLSPAFSQYLDGYGVRNCCDIAQGCPSNSVSNVLLFKQYHFVEAIKAIPKQPWFLK